jgi:hypothetical protein
MKYKKYSGSGKRLGERKRYKIKKKPITGIELELLRIKNEVKNNSKTIKN